MSTAAIALLVGAGTAAAQQQAPSPATSAPPQSAPPAADNSLGTVIVTARQRRENVQRVPTTVTAVSGEQLRQQNIVTVQDLATIAPSLTIESFFNGLNASYAVRGLAAGVTQYFSEAPCCTGTASTPFLDTASVQVLNGPQGTLFGRSSASGAILIDPQHPKMNEFGGLVDVTVGDYDRAQFTGVLNIPLITDHLAVRIAANSNSIQGYTSLFGSSQKLDGVNNQQYRVGIEFKAGGFDNYVTANYLNIDESGTSEVLDAANPNYSLYTLPQAAGPAVFGSVCTQAISLGLTTSSLSGCETQRVDDLHLIGQSLQTELQRVSAGGIRSTAPSYNGMPQFNLEHHASLVDIAQYDFGDVGPVNLNVKNIFSFDSITSDSTTTNDGIGGLGEEGPFANSTFDLYGANNEKGNMVTAQLSAPLATYTDEFQIHGDIGQGLLKPTLGVFYLDQTMPTVTTGTTNVYQIFSGVLTPNLGFQNADGFVDKDVTTEAAWYAQATLDLSKVGIHGLSLTGGYRDTWDKTVYTSSPPVINYVTGIYSPGSPPSTTTSASSGYNFTFSVAEQWNDDLMTYATVSRAYVPGGVNSQGQGGVGLPGYTPTWAAEDVLDEEVGIKSDFSFGQVHGRLDADIYNMDFTNIAETLVGLVGTTSIEYTENAAAATLQGVEVTGTIIPDKSLRVSFAYSYNDAHYTKWIGADPFNEATAGSANCVTQSPVGQCWLNLKNNPFEDMPANQGHVTFVYTLPFNPSLGDMNASVTVYAQDREYFEADFARDLQLNPQAYAAASQAPYVTLNLRFDWANVNGSGWNTAVFLNNATNAVYATGKVNQIETLGFSSANYAAPIMFGAEINKKFGW